MPKIAAAVGKTGPNNLQDVRVVQQLLNRFQPLSVPLMKVDGRLGPATIAKIARFQLEQKIKPAEPNITPDGATFKALCGGDPSQDLIAWGANVSAAFKQKVLTMADALQIPADFIMAAMAFETGETFDPSVRNSGGGSATGLLQFTRIGAEGMGTTTEELAKLTALQQLDWVQTYLSKKGTLQSLEDVYMSVFSPHNVRKSPDTVLYSAPSDVYKSNKGMDLDKNGEITIREATTKVREKYTKGVQKPLLA